MKAILIPVVLTLVGLGAGIGAGMFLGGGGEEEQAEEGAEPKEGEAGEKDSKKEEEKADDEATTDDEPFEFARLSNQFVVPVVRGDAVEAMVVLSITLEVEVGSTETVFQSEPRLRDRFLRVLFDHANIGGFDSGFTQSGNMTLLRRALREAARDTLGSLVRDVLIVDIVRQEV